MGANPIIQLGKQCSAILVSGKLFNNGDGLICLTGGRLAAFSGHRYSFLMVGRINAKSMSRQLSLIIGQMHPNWLKVL